MTDPFLVSTLVRLLAMGTLIGAALYAKRLPSGGARHWPIAGALAVCLALVIWETVYLRPYREAARTRHAARMGRSDTAPK